MKTRSLRIALLLFVSISFVFAQPKTITILHTNDIHASFVPHEAFWVKGNPKPLIGGFKELEVVADSIRRAEKLTLLFDAGDVMTGNPITEFVYNGAEGGALFEMMNMLDYDAWTVGNHDFDVSVNNLKKLTSIAHFPTLAANIRDSANTAPVNNKDYIIITKGGIRFGVFGIMSREFYSLVNKNSSRNIKILDPIKTSKQMVALLRPQADVIIALTHQGVSDDTVLASRVDGIDIIIGGHSHTRLQKPKRINNILIVQTGSNCEYLGVITLTVDHGKILSSNGKLISLWVRDEYPTTKLTSFVDSMQNVIEKSYSEVLGELRTPWVRGRGGESGIGDFITDAQREAAHADVAFMNDHGIRQDLPEGKITKRKLFEVLPFRNVLGVFSLRGDQLKAAVEYAIRTRSPIQTSGLNVVWKKKDDGSIEFVQFLVNGQPIRDDRIYTVAASDYLIGESKRYLGIEISDYTLLDKTVFSVVEQKIRATGVIESKVEGRIKQISK
ncbi:MAG TPA: bifunctional UDP-sugar hydrolase/5'-nucleotidase [Bacteroidota bacterium]|nr:bifunctional UDP-sugar hydrolase/5'-nucleotidase [Bacteroidota bacterium]